MFSPGTLVECSNTICSPRYNWNEAGTDYPSGTPVFTPFNGGYCCSIFSFICMFCRSLFVILYFFIRPLHFRSFFDLRLLITPLVSSQFSLKCCYVCLALYTYIYILPSITTMCIPDITVVFNIYSISYTFNN